METKNILITMKNGDQIISDMVTDLVTEVTSTVVDEEIL